jgi:hypothetical protein
MTGVWVTVAVLALATAGLKLAGPLILGGRTLPPGTMAIVELLASALLAALVVVESLGKGRSLSLDARALGVAFAAVVLLRRGPLIVAVGGAALVAALARLLT